MTIPDRPPDEAVVQATISRVAADAVKLQELGRRARGRGYLGSVETSAAEPNALNITCRLRTAELLYRDLLEMGSVTPTTVTGRACRVAARLVRKAIDHGHRQKG